MGWVCADGVKLNFGFMKQIFIFFLAFFLFNICIGQSVHELNEQVNVLFKQGDFSLAVQYAEKALAKAEKEYGKLHKYYYTSLNNLADLYQTIGHHDKALPLFIEALDVISKSLGKSHPDYSTILNNLALQFKTTGQYEKALPLFIEALDITSKYLGKDHAYYGTSLNNLADLYKTMGYYEKAFPLMIEALDVTSKSLGKNHQDYSIRLNSLANLYLAMGQYAKALSLYLEALDVTSQSLGKNHSDYGMRLNNLAYLYQTMGQYEKALPLYLEALEVTSKTLGENHSDYGTYVNNLADLYQTMGQYEKALPLFIEALDITSKSLGKNHKDYGNRLNNLALQYHMIGQYEKALLLYLESIELTSKTLGEKHPDYGLRLNNLAGLYQTMGHYEKALPLFIESIDIVSQTIGKNHADYGTRLNNLATLYQVMGQYEKALLFYDEALDITSKSLGKNHPDYGKYLNNLALLNQTIGHNDRALLLFIEALEITSKSLGKNHPDYGKYLNNLAKLHQAMDQHYQAFLLFVEALDITSQNLGKKHPNYGAILNNLALLFQTMGQYEKALSFYVEALDVTLGSLGKNHADYGTLLINLASLYQNLDQDQKALPLYLEGLENIKNQIANQFLFLSEKDKEQFIQTFELNFACYNSFFYNCSLLNFEVQKNSFDLSLMIKGMILNSTNEFQSSINQSSDTTVHNEFNSWVFIKNIIAKEYGKPIAQRRNDLKILEDKADLIEGELVRKSSAFTKQQRKSKITWKNVHSTLSNKDVAIEISHFRYRSPKSWTDSIMYVALILRAKDSVPQMVKLFEQNQLDSLLARKHDKESQKVNDLYHQKRLYELIWKPLEKYVNKGDQIYYSPSGSLHQINLGAISVNDTVYLSDIYRFHQVSSTAILVSSESIDQKIKHISIFGGMDYETKEEDILKSIKNISSGIDFVSRGIYTQDSTRSGKWLYLPGTKLEAENIYEICKETNISAQLYMGTDALEEQYKNLDGDKSPSILHIATHGFFFPDPKTSKEKLDRMTIHTDNPFTIADNPMNRSGLLFSGSNKAWIGDSISLDREDGILTAYEASHTYLKNTKLVVLSACETGLGDIKGSEGVYGLQRAFKMAGARYLMMSLWKVPDNATQEFMTTFYTELLTNKKSTRDAYNTTQKQTRDKYRGEPYKWGGFVLME